jgi:hypothetical protein
MVGSPDPLRLQLVGEDARRRRSSAVASSSMKKV